MMPATTSSREPPIQLNSCIAMSSASVEEGPTSFVSSAIEPDRSAGSGATTPRTAPANAGGRRIRIAGFKGGGAVRTADRSTARAGGGGANGGGLSGIIGGGTACIVGGGGGDDTDGGGVVDGGGGEPGREDPDDI